MQTSEEALGSVLSCGRWGHNLEEERWAEKTSGQHTPGQLEQAGRSPTGGWVRGPEARESGSLGPGWSSVRPEGEQMMKDLEGFSEDE